MTDTIIALATPEGESALALIRISGPLCTSLLESALALPHPTPRRSTLTSYVNRDCEIVDQVVVCFFENGKSFTGEESLEISAHGNLLIIKKIIDDLLDRGCRAAEPGEFSRRAFLSGKMDLTQAEAVAALISAKSETEINLAQKNLRGSLSTEIKEIQKTLIGQQAILEAEIDFPEEEIEEKNNNEILLQLIEVESNIKYLMDFETKSKCLNNGIKVLLLGPPNAGKSTLFNSILGSERTLVSSEPGTTRDYISSSIRLNKFVVDLVDSAGVRQGVNSIEKLGVSNTIEFIHDADLIILVFDASIPYPSEFNGMILDRINGKRIIIVENKSDLIKKINREAYPTNEGIIEASAINKIGIESLTALIEKILESTYASTNGSFILVNSRHCQSLAMCRLSVANACKILESDGDRLLVLHEIKKSLQYLGEIIGFTTNEDMLDELFAKFCIGK